jgi:hypothetical protein
MPAPNLMLSLYSLYPLYLLSLVPAGDWRGVLGRHWLHFRANCCHHHTTLTLLLYLLRFVAAGDWRGVLGRVWLLSLPTAATTTPP